MGSTLIVVLNTFHHLIVALDFKNLLLFIAWVLDFLNLLYQLISFSDIVNIPLHFSYTEIFKLPALVSHSIAFS